MAEPALQADVEFVTNTGVFAGEMGLIRDEADKTYGAISTSSLKAVKVQEQYARVLSKNAIESTAVRDATVRYREQMAALEAQTARTAAANDAEGASISRVGEKAVSSAGHLGIFAKAANFASTALIGGFGLAFALKSVVSAAQDEQVALTQLQTSLTNAGLSWSKYGGEIEAAVSKQERGSGFDKIDITAALARNITRYGDVQKALQATAAAEDVARQRGISLADAQTLLQRASLGNTKAARTLGIQFVATASNLQNLRDTTKHATADQVAQAKAADLAANRTALLAAIEAKYHGAAAAYLQTTAGKEQLFNAELKDTEAIIGQALLPTFNKYLGELTSSLSKSENQQRIQRDANTVIKDGGEALHILGDALKVVTTLTGGLKNALELLIALKFAKLVTGWSSSLAGIGTSVKASAAETAVATTAVEGDVAAIGAASVVAEGEVLSLRASLLSLGAPEVLAAIAAVAGAEYASSETTKVSQKVFGETGYTTLGTDKYGRQISYKDGKFDAGDTTDTGKYGFHLGGSLTEEQAAKALGISVPDLEREVGNRSDVQTGAPQAAHGKKGATGTTGGGRGGGKPPATTYKVTGVALLNQNLAEAQASGDPAAIKSATEAKLKYDEQAAAFAKKRLGSGKGSPSLYSQYQQVLADEATQRSTLTSLASSSTTAANKAASAHYKAVETQQKDLENRVKKASLLYSTSTRKTGALLLHPAAAKAAFAKETKAYNAEIAYDRKEAKDKSLTPEERSGETAAALALVQRRNDAKTKRDTQIASARKREISKLTEIPDNLKAALNLAKTEQQKVAANKAELKALQDQLVIIKKIGGTKDDIEKNRLAQSEVQKRINDLTGKSGPTDEQKNESQFLTEFASDVSAYAPNAVPLGTKTKSPLASGKAETHLYEAVHELRGIKAHLSTVVKKTKFPASEYALTSASGVFG